MQRTHTCPECHRTFERHYCDYCRRERQWEHQLQYRYIQQFSPRIQDDLKHFTFPKTVIQQYLEKLAHFHHLFFTGHPKSGKTLFAVQLSLERRKQLYIDKQWEEHTFITMADLLAQIKQSFDSDAIDESQIIRRYSTAPFLILDDLGPEKVSEWSLQTLYLIINTRYEQHKSTIITSNYTLEELTDHLQHSRIPSRIERMSGQQYYIDFSSSDMPQQDLFLK